jgi:hypothetical protein
MLNYCYDLGRKFSCLHHSQVALQWTEVAHVVDVVIY